MGQIPIGVLDLRYLGVDSKSETITVHVSSEAAEAPGTIKFLDPKPAAPRPARRLLWDAVKTTHRWPRLRGWIRERAAWSSLLVMLGLGAGVVAVALVKLLVSAWLVLLSAVAIPAWVVGLVVDGK